MATISRINKYESTDSGRSLLKLLDERVSEVYSMNRSLYDNALEGTIDRDYEDTLSNQEASKFLIKVFGNNYNNQEIIDDIKKMKVSVVNGVISVDEKGTKLKNVIDVDDFIDNLTSY